jgi:N-acetyl-alpha-D-glucosaminyl L-malate synthase BshA
MPDRPLKIGITCYPSVGGSGILASELGAQLAQRGHEIHFISYEAPFRLPEGPRVHFHPVQVNSYDLFKYPDYTLPLSVKMAEVSRDHGLDVLHVHYAVPHATAAILARAMLHEERRLRIITTLHGTDTTLLGRDPGYGPAIRHALEHSDAITTVSEFMRGETVRLLGVQRPIEVIPNFFEPHATTHCRDDMRRELGLADGEAMLLHLSNLRPLKRTDLLLDTVAKLKPRLPFKLVVLAGADPTPLLAEARRLGVADRLIVREKVTDIECYLAAADLGLFTSEVESFCLSILELMSVGCPSAAFAVGGIPEVTISGETGLLAPFGDTTALAAGIETLLGDPARRAAPRPRRAATRARAMFFCRCRRSALRGALPSDVRYLIEPHQPTDHSAAMEPSDPAPKTYGFKEREFKRDNVRSAADAPLPTAKEMAIMAGPVTASPKGATGPKAGDPNDVYTALQQESCATERRPLALSEVEIHEGQSAERKRDYCLLHRGGNAGHCSASITAVGPGQSP